MKNYQTEERELLVRPYPDIQVGSRLNYTKKLGKTEPPNIKNIMQKVGIDCSDKPLFNTLEEEILNEDKENTNV